MFSVTSGFYCEVASVHELFLSHLYRLTDLPTVLGHVSCINREERFSIWIYLPHSAQKQLAFVCAPMSLFSRMDMCWVHVCKWSLIKCSLFNSFMRHEVHYLQWLCSAHTKASMLKIVGGINYQSCSGCLRLFYPKCLSKRIGANGTTKTWRTPGIRACRCVRSCFF